MSASQSDSNIIQYVPFTSFVHPSFWHSLTDLKLNVDKLNESTKQIYGRFTYRDDIGAVFEVDGTSFNKEPETEMQYINLMGTLINKNTIEDFKSIDKASLLNSIGELVWASIKTRSWIDNPSSLLNFFILSFADIKKFHYYYWFAFPSPSQPTVCLKEKSSNISTGFTENQLKELAQSYQILDDAQKSFFVIKLENEKITIETLSKVFDINKSQEKLCFNFTKTYFAFTDPSDGENPGWPLRLFLAALLEYTAMVDLTEIQVIGIRCSKDGEVGNSKIFNVIIPENVQSSENVGWVGWERNDRGNFGPKLANMSASMDPIKLADTSSNLNVKLMQWRLAPNLDVQVMKYTKCLLLGAGTLGCHVARNLLAWDFRHITFVDSGKVSYSNPTRQVLFQFENCLNGGRRKAEAAAENLTLILPTVKTEGLVLHIPMPGHPVGESLREETISNIQQLTEAISSHDVIFLLLDTREARWLPTLIAAHYGKIVINAALGFDSYLVMRHGVSPGAAQPAAVSSHHVPGGELGCYFCNDVTAPGNSLKDRTLDQQCTVTRPGVAAIAGALAVEVLVALLQHPLRAQAPALYNISNEEMDPQYQGILGPVPHSIRGFLHSYQTVLPTCPKFKQCIACSDVVIDKYRTEGIEFLLNVFNSGKYLEEITGLSELQLTAEMTDILMFSDEDQEST